MQIDSINVLERAHYLTRLEPLRAVRPRHARPLAYGRRAAVRVLGACRLPGRHLAAALLAASDARLLACATPAGRALAADEPKVSRSGARRRSAPRAASATPISRAAAPRGAPAGGTGSPPPHALHYLWMTGAHHWSHSRRHFQKRFDLVERVPSPRFASSRPPLAGGVPRAGTSALAQAMGAATENDLRLYLTFPRFAAACAPRGARARCRDAARWRRSRSRATRALVRARRGSAGARARRRRRARRAAARRCSRRSILCSGIASARAACSASTTASRSTRPGTSASTVLLAADPPRRLS